MSLKEQGAGRCGTTAGEGGVHCACHTSFTCGTPATHQPLCLYSFDCEVRTSQLVPRFHNSTLAAMWPDDLATLAATVVAVLVVVHLLFRAVSPRTRHLPNPTDDEVYGERSSCLCAFSSSKSICVHGLAACCEVPCIHMKSCAMLQVYKFAVL